MDQCRPNVDPCGVQKKIRRSRVKTNLRFGFPIIDLVGKDTHIRGVRALVYLQYLSSTPGGHPDTGGAQGVGRTYSRPVPFNSVPSTWSERTPILEVFGHSYTFSTRVAPPAGTQTLVEPKGSVRHTPDMLHRSQHHRLTRKGHPY